MRFDGWNRSDSLEINDACVGTAVAVAGERSVSAGSADVHLLEHQMRIHTRTFVVLVFAVLAPVPLIAQTAAPPPAFLGDSLVGKDSFEAYCASCHGSDGRGGGPVARALKGTPADLTALASRNGDVFPRDRVRATLTGAGRTVSAHGTTEMPIWGPLFRAFESDARARVRIDNLVKHVETLQARPARTGESGAALFRTYCASCHGSDGRGAGPMADQLRRLPPSLTSFAARNGGLFPSERVRRIIDGRDIPSHGTTEMPVWGDAFRRSREGLSDAAAAARIDAIVRFLESIQERATF
jgi:mono/diheme cytochrome c family protein